MAKKLISLTLFLTIISIAIAQTGKISGKVLNQKNEPIAGVSVKILGAPGGITTDVEGRYILTLATGKKYSIEFTAIGYQPKAIDEVEPIAGQVTELNITLEISGKNLGAVTVTATRSNARRETTTSLLQFQKNTNTVASVVSAEAIRRSPDKNTGEILKRVPGASVQEGKYLIVRGLADRYNQAMLNGILLSSTEPDRKTFSFDIFPASVIDNIIINKAFVPEYPGEWAGGLVQVNTRDIPASNFWYVEVGTGVNTNTIGNDFYKYKGSNLDWLGFDNKVRALPAGWPNKSTFNELSNDEKTAWGGKFENNWGVHTTRFQPNAQFQVSTGFTGDVFHKKFGGTVGVNYNRNIRHGEFENSYFSITNSLASPDFIYNTDKYAEDVLWGAIANFTLALNPNNKISVKNLFNVNATNYTSLRTGQEFISGTDNVRSRELAMRTNTFFNTQIAGEHNLPKQKIKLNWYGSFNILDAYVPQQRRVEYIQDATTPGAPFLARLSQGSSQKSGSIFYENLNDYIYTAGGDLTKNFDWLNNKQSIKGGYMLQVKDRLFDAKPYYIKLFDNSLKNLPEDQIFAQEHFAPGVLGFDQIYGDVYRYMANTILNAGYVQLDNQFSPRLRAVWGVRYENFDQLIGSVKTSDRRHTHSKVEDWLPALNLTYKVNNTTNLRLSGSQTVVRPEFRELTDFTFYDFELGASVIGNKNLVRTKVTNLDLRYEIYPRAGEVFTLGVFFKNFKSPIELYLNQTGAGSSNTFNYFDNFSTTARGYGAEFEMRKKLDFSQALKNFTFTSNLSYIYNRVKNAGISLDRPMQGQSPYVINAGLQYDHEKAGLTTTLLFNEIGRRIVYVGNDQMPAIWEAPRPLLDFQVAKKIIKNKGILKLNVSDILNQKAKYYHDLNDDGKYTKENDALAISRKLGTTFSLVFGYTFK